MEPRSIDPGEIRVNDNVRAEFDVGALEGYVASAGRGSIVIRYHQNSAKAVETHVANWFLLDRPEPPREPWSRWVDPETETQYARTNETAPARVHYVPVVCKKGVLHDPLSPSRWRDAEIIARLVPLDGDR